MSEPVAPARFSLEPIPENLFREPVDFLYADHYRQRELCDLMEAKLCRDARTAVSETAALVLDFIERDLPLHIADEERELFPLLRLRCRAEDGFDALLAMLQDEHNKDDALAEELCTGLRHLAAGRRLTDAVAFRQHVSAFTEALRRHLSWENEVLLPLARRRLTAADKLLIGRSMAARRGIEFPE
ncbi:MAG: hypothetical protein BroJett029_31360 [Alphaproteobacteria bacterium]|nr:MAG: hypothetical protein BroJett029_31360 [Alphaproteobacteria bacterium]